jgi:hypothetical protein
MLTVCLFIKIDEVIPLWYDALSVVIQLIEIAIIMLIIVQVFAIKSLKMDLNLTLVVTSLVGPCYDFFKSIQNEISNQLTKRRQKVSNEKKEIINKAKTTLVFLDAARMRPIRVPLPIIEALHLQIEKNGQ